MNIRIGNDVTLDITLNEQKFDGKQLNKAVCYLFNVDRNTKSVQEDLYKFVVDKPKSYIPTKYTIHGCGIPSYNVDLGVHPHDRGLSVYDHCLNKDEKRDVYTVIPTIEDDLHLTCVFPKSELNKIGRYKLVVETAVSDEFGVHTYTFDYGVVFSLTDNVLGLTGEIKISVPNLTGSVGVIRAVNTVITVDQDSSLAINSEDKYGSKYALLVVVSDGSVIQYNPLDWQHSNIIFKSSDPDIVTVDEYGTITTFKSKIGRDVVITAYDQDDVFVNAEFIVHVSGSDSDYTSQLFSTQVYDPINQINQSLINSNILASIHAMENLVGKTIDDMFIVVTSLDNYDNLAQLNQIRNNTFYYTYDSEEEPAEGPDRPPIYNDYVVANHVLYASGTINNGILTVSGSVTNNILKL